MWAIFLFIDNNSCKLQGRPPAPQRSHNQTSLQRGHLRQQPCRSQASLHGGDRGHRGLLWQGAAHHAALRDRAPRQNREICEGKTDIGSHTGLTTVGVGRVAGDLVISHEITSEIQKLATPTSLLDLKYDVKFRCDFLDFS